MRRATPVFGFSNPFLVWAELGIRTSEMMTGAALVIGHRTSRMAASGPRPSARDRREMTVMQQEKVRAAGQSVNAMTRAMLTTDPLLAVRLYRQMLTGAGALMSLAASRGMDQFLARQVVLQRSMMQSASAASEMSQAGARLFQRGLGPIHARVRANARRLGK